MVSKSSKEKTKNVAPVGASDLSEKQPQLVSEQKFDMSGNPRCRLCGKSPLKQDFETHLRVEHKTDVAAYRKSFPEWPLDARPAGDATSLAFHVREKQKYSVASLFGFLWQKAGVEPKDRMVEGYREAGPLTPAVDDSYVFDPEITQVALLALHLKDKVLMYGPTGAGKTTLWEQIAARLKYNLVRINFDGGVTRSDLIGQWIVRGREMEFTYGILPMAMMLPGTIILFDEWDTASEECSFVLQRPLERNSQLLLLEKGQEVITMNEENTIVATANTAGMGDQSGLYTGTRVQNYSQINRFSLTIEVSYLLVEQEKTLLLKRFGEAEDGLKEAEATGLATVASFARQAFLKGEISTPLSTRDLINWASKYLIWGDFQKAAKYCFLNRMSVEDRLLVSGLIKRAFESKKSK